MEYEGQTLSGAVELDGNSFIDCRFQDATLIYRGGVAPRLINCSFDPPRWNFRMPPPTRSGCSAPCRARKAACAIWPRGCSGRYWARTAPCRPILWKWLLKRGLEWALIVRRTPDGGGTWGARATLWITRPSTASIGRAVMNGPCELTVRGSRSAICQPDRAQLVSCNSVAGDVPLTSVSSGWFIRSISPWLST